MLSELRISNFLLIEELHLSLDRGFMAITGETGAGKSIILGALKLVLGGRADLQQIKNQAHRCVLEASFKHSNTTDLLAFLKQNDIEIWEEIILRREISPNGNSRCFINDSPVNQEILKKISPYLIDIHSQFNTTDLAEENYPLEVLDIVAKNEAILKDYQAHYKEWKKEEDELIKIKENLAERQKNADYNQFLLQELEEINIHNPGEQIQLENDLALQENAEKILLGLQTSHSILEDENFGLMQQLRKLEQETSNLSSYSKPLQDIAKRIESTRIEMQDISSELEHVSTQIEIDPIKLQESRSRLSEFYRLQKKHGVTELAQLIEIQNKLSSENVDNENLEKQISILEDKIAHHLDKLDEISKVLQKNRQSAIVEVEKNITESLSLLGMPKAKIKFELATTEKFNLLGKDKAIILFSANTGMPFGLLEKVASGGERSRLMFAIKKMLAQNKKMPSLIFDEIDTGISGKIANDMGNLMKEMSQDTQLIIITHLAQIAAKGSKHYKVFKSIHDTKTLTHIKELNPQEREVEIATMISGSDISQAAINQAKELLK